VRPVIVVVAFELLQHGCGVSLVEDQDSVEEFAADRADEALGDRVGPRRAHRCLDDPDVDGGEDGVEGGLQLRGERQGTGRARSDPAGVSGKRSFPSRFVPSMPGAVVGVAAADRMTFLGPAWDHTLPGVEDDLHRRHVVRRVLKALTCINAKPQVVGVKGSQVQILSSRQIAQGPLNSCLSWSAAFGVVAHDRNHGLRGSPLGTVWGPRCAKVGAE